LAIITGFGDDVMYGKSTSYVFAVGRGNCALEENYASSYIDINRIVNVALRDG